jgi:hypothetical protein
MTVGICENLANAALQLRRAISIESVARSMFEKHAIAPSLFVGRRR